MQMFLKLEVSGTIDSD